MAALIAQNLAPIMFAALVVFLLLGYPVAFALAANGLLFFFIAVELAPLAPDTITLSWPFLQALPDRIFGTMSNEVLLAVPFFTFMGLVLERSGMAEDLLDTIGQLFGPVRGGLAYAVIFVGALLAATTGVVAASVISMGLISLPIMLRYGYDRRLASGVIAASGTLAQIIPPSLVLIVMADQLGRSVGDMYEGAFLPGLILTGLYAGYIMLMSIIYPKSAPGLPPEAIGYREPDGARGVWQLGILVVFSGLVGYYVLSQTNTKAGADFVILTICVATVVALICALMNKMLGAKRIAISAVLVALLVGAYVVLHNQGHEGLALTFEMILAGAIYALIVGIVERFTGLRLMSNMAQQVTFVMVPPLLLIFLVLGTIFIGLATPTEGGAMGALGSVILAAVKRKLDNNPARFNWTLVRQATEATAKLSAFVLFILIGARVFSLTFYGVNGHIWVEHLLTSLPGGQVGFLVFVNVLVFFLAFFLDYFELAFIIIPLLGPAADKLGIDLIWFGVILAVNMQTSFMHPPFGFALFFLRSVAPKVPYIDRLTGKKMEPVTTGQIYWGAVPFVIIQLIMVGIVIAFPQIVMHYKAAGPAVDPAAVQQKLDQLLVPGLGAPGDPGGLPSLNFDEPPKIQ
ncbi:TRAP transporter large permease subunit [Microvirga sp. VF16]|uniref:TRAP transporter large permease n=1 Tax=Microvirga sp. VF16 TaxID=2807101 RepID=UPI00193D12B6|nr:TRAP transporter large permease subunit [Microvirga sp. VF16]QRM27208.1 TRAP transporter large permease subunit [Microvirga sp. VF16]